MAINLVLSLTLNGKDAFWNSKNTGVKLDITHLQFGTRNRQTTGEESFLNQPKQYTQIQNGSKIGPDQVRIMATMPGVENYNVNEIGLWSGVPDQAGSILIAYKSVQTGFIAQMVSGIDLVFTYDMVVSTIDIDYVNIVKDTDQSSTFSLLAIHESDRNAHPYYLTTDTAQTISGAKTFSKKAIFSGGLSGELTGNAASATKLKTARKINKIPFDGTSDIDIAAGLPIGHVHHRVCARNQIPDGELALDGLVFNRADYADLWAKAQASALVIDDATWLANPLARIAYSSGNGTTTFRLPDYNGIQSGSLKSPVLRGDGYSSSGTALSDAIRNIKGTFIGGSNWNFTELFTRLNTVHPTINGGGGASQHTYEFNASKVVPTADENRPVSAFGIYVVVAKGRTENAPSSGTYPTLTGSNIWNGSQDVQGNLLVNGKITGDIRSSINAEGDAPISAIRSYVIGSATSAPTILRSMNVASVTKPASSQLTVNFIKPMTDTNYIVLAYAKYTTAPNEQIGGITTTKTVNSCTINFRVPGSQSDNAPEYTVVIL